MIKNVIFDIGSVLVSFDWQEFLQKLGITGEAYEVISEHIFNDMWGKLDKCACDESETRKRLLEAAEDYHDEIKLICDNIYDISSPYEYACDWVNDLKQRGYNVYLLSNFGKFQFETLLKKYDFVRLVDGKVISYEIEEVKPDKAIYEHLLEKYSLKPHECVFIDDREENIDTAVRLGINGIVFTTYNETRNMLDEFLK